MEFTFINRGRGQVLLCDGYQYSKKKQYVNNAIWYKCSKCAKTKCLGSITLKDNQIIKKVDHASHCLPSSTQNLFLEKMENCKQNISRGDGKPLPEIYNETIEEFQNSGLDLVCNIPPFKKVKSGLYKRRNHSLGVTKIQYKKAEDVEIPIQFHDFLLSDFNEDGIRVILFCSEEVKKNISQFNTFFGDGTFKISPSPFLQLYSIHGDTGSTSTLTEVTPLIYALMSHKTYEAYVVLYSMIRSQIADWNPKKFLTDFEEGAMKAMKFVFPDVVIKGCWFHFKTCLFRKAKTMEMLKDKHARRCISLCGSMALLPNEHIVYGWDYIKKEYSNVSNVTEFLEYFEKFWMRKDIIDVWCVANERHRTNNSLEGWHHNAFRRNSTNIVRLLNVLSKDANLNEVRFLQKTSNSLSEQSSTSNRCKKTITLDDLIIQYQVQLLTGEITIGHFLEKLR